MTDRFVTPRKQAALNAEMERLGVTDGELTEKFILGSGKGGQKVNKTSSCVYLKHAPSGIEIKCQRSRSRELNRYFARVDLCERLKQQIDGERSRRQAEAAKIRRQKARRSRRSKEKMLDAKRQQGEKKSLRGRVRPAD